MRVQTKQQLGHGDAPHDQVSPSNLQLRQAAVYHEQSRNEAVSTMSLQHTATFTLQRQCCKHMIRIVVTQMSAYQLQLRLQQR